MHRSSAQVEMVSRCQTQTFPDITGLTFSVFGGKAEEMCARKGFGSQIYRNSSDAHSMSSACPKRLIAQSEERAHLTAKSARLCLSLPPLQGRLIQHQQMLQGCWRDYLWQWRLKWIQTRFGCNCIISNEPDLIIGFELTETFLLLLQLNCPIKHPVMQMCFCSFRLGLIIKHRAPWDSFGCS